MNVDEAIEIAASTAETVLATEVERLKAELEKERIRLAACGVVAMSNTEDSLNKIFSGIHPDYLCASLKDVKTAVKREIKLRLEVERLRGELSAEGTAGELILQDNRDLRIENKRLQAELAAAKAASVCPVEIGGVYENSHTAKVLIELGSDDDASKFIDWLDHMTESGAG